jgi:RHS repeat-associated protein
VNKYFYFRDHLGSIREMMISNGAVVARFDYDPWGRSTTVINTTLPDFNYTGLYRHGASGLDMAVHRFYDPDLGRWLSRDPIANAEIDQGPNLYWYVENDPTKKIDPLGTDIWIGGGFWHQNFNIGTPNNVLGSYSYGLDVTSPLSLDYGVTGAVYEDWRTNSPVSPSDYLRTSPEQDQQALAALDSLVGSRGPYRFTYPDCFSFSRQMFELFRDQFGPSQPSPGPAPTPSP